MARSIQEMFAKFKPFLEDDRLFYGALVILIAVVSFGLGKLSGGEYRPNASENKPIMLTESAGAGFLLPTTTHSMHVEAGSENAAYVGSRNGTKYHAPWCPGAGQIKDSNKIYFSSKEEAERAGYTPASNCKGI